MVVGRDPNQLLDLVKQCDAAAIEHLLNTSGSNQGRLLITADIQKQIDAHAEENKHIGEVLIECRSITAKMRVGVPYTKEEFIKLLNKAPYNNIPELPRLLSAIQTKTRPNQLTLTFEDIRSVEAPLLEKFERIADTLNLFPNSSYPLSKEAGYITFHDVDTHQPVTIPAKDLDIVEKLGSGGFGEVSRCRYIGDDERVRQLCKKVKDPNDPTKEYYWFAIKTSLEGNVADIQEEGEIGTQLAKHGLALSNNDQTIPYNLAQSAWMSTDPTNPHQLVAVISQLETYGLDEDLRPLSSDLQNFLGKVKEATSTPSSTSLTKAAQSIQDFQQNFAFNFANIFRSIHEGIVQIGNSNVVHMDVALRNMFVDAVIGEDGKTTFTAKPADYGKGRIQNANGLVTEKDRDRAPLLWLSKDRVSGKEVSRYTDFYSYRIMFLEVMAIQLGVSLNEILDVSGQPKVLQPNNQYPLSDQLTIALRVRASTDDSVPLSIFFNNAEQILQQRRLEGYLNPETYAYLQRMLNAYGAYVQNPITDPLLSPEEKVIADQKLYEQCHRTFLIQTLEEEFIKMGGLEKILENINNNDFSLIPAILEIIKKVNIKTLSIDHATAAETFIIHSFRELSKLELVNLEAKKSYLSTIFETLNRSYDDFLINQAAELGLAPDMARTIKAPVLQQIVAIKREGAGLIATYNEQKKLATATVTKNEDELKAEDFAFISDDVAETTQNKVTELQTKISNLPTVIPVTFIHSISSELTKIKDDLPNQNELWKKYSARKKQFIQEREAPLERSREQHHTSYQLLKNKLKGSKRKVLAGPKITPIEFARALFLIKELQDLNRQAQALGIRNDNLTTTVINILDQDMGEWKKLGKKEKNKAIWDEYNLLESDLVRVGARKAPEEKGKEFFLKVQQAYIHIEAENLVSKMEMIEKRLKNKDTPVEELGKDINELTEAEKIFTAVNEELDKTTTDADTMLAFAALHGASENELTRGKAVIETAQRLKSLKKQVERALLAPTTRFKEQRKLNVERLLQDIEQSRNVSIPYTVYTQEIVNLPAQSDHAMALEESPELAERYAESYGLAVDRMTNSLIALEKEIVDKINPNEFYKKSDEPRDQRPNLAAYSEHFNKVSAFIIQDILYRDGTERALAIEYWINVAARCLNNPSLKSMGTAMAIHSALENSAISRLAAMKTGLSPQALDTLNRLHVQTSSGDSSRKAIRQYMKKNPDAIPFIGIYLTDFEFVRVNAEKDANKATTNAIGGSRAVHKAYEFNKNLREMLSNVKKQTVSGPLLKSLKDDIDKAPDEDTLYPISRELEPNVEETKKKVKPKPTAAQKVASIIYTMSRPKKGEAKPSTVNSSIYRARTAALTAAPSVATQPRQSALIILDKDNLAFQSAIAKFGDDEIAYLQAPSETGVPADIHYIVVGNADIQGQGPLSLFTASAQAAGIDTNNVYFLDQYARDLFANKQNHFNSKNDLADEPPTRKIMALVYLLQTNNGEFFKHLDPGVVANRVEMAKHFIDELTEPEFNQLNDLILNTPNLPQGIKEHIADIEKLHDSKVSLHFEKHPSKVEIARALQDKMADMAKFLRVGDKPGGANKPGKFGGVYEFEYTVGNSKTVYKQKILFKQDTKGSKINHDKIIAEFASGYLLNHMIDASAAAIVMLPAPPEKEVPVPLPDESGDHIYIGSVFFDDFEELFKKMGYEDRGAFHEARHPDKFFNALCRISPTGEPECRFYNFEDVTAASLLVGGFDNHSGNLGAVPLPANHLSDKEGELVVIDHGANLYRLEDEVHIHSRTRHLPGKGPTNHFLDIPRELKVTPTFADALDRQANKEMETPIAEYLKILDKMLGPKPILTYALHLRMPVDKSIMDSLSPPWYVKRPTMTEAQAENIKQTLLKDIAEFQKHKMKMRQDSMKNLATEIRLSLCLQKDKTDGKFKFVEYQYQDKENKPQSFKIERLIQDNPNYFLRGNFHLRGKDQKDQIAGWRIGSGTHTRLVNTINEYLVDESLDAIITRAREKQDLKQIELILANKKLCALYYQRKPNAEKIDNVYKTVLDEIVTAHHGYNMKAYNNNDVVGAMQHATQNTHDLIVTELLDEKSTDIRVMIMHRWISRMEKARAEGDLASAIDIYRGLRSPEVAILKQTFNRLNKNAKAILNEMDKNLRTDNHFDTTKAIAFVNREKARASNANDFVPALIDATQQQVDFADNREKKELSEKLQNARTNEVSFEQKFGKPVRIPKKPSKFLIHSLEPQRTWSFFGSNQKSSNDFIISKPVTGPIPVAENPNAAVVTTPASSAQLSKSTNASTNDVRVGLRNAIDMLINAVELLDQEIVAYAKKHEPDLVPEAEKLLADHKKVKPVEKGSHPSLPKDAPSFFNGTARKPVNDTKTPAAANDRETTPLLTGQPNTNGKPNT